LSSNLHARRKCWLVVHLWLGLFAGAVLSITALTGSVLVFRHELELLMDASTWRVEPGSSTRSPLDLAKSAEALLPIEAKISWVEFPLTPDEVVQLNYQLVSKSVDGESDGYSVLLNPYTAQITGTRLSEPGADLSATPLIPLLFKLHYSLLLGESGGTFLGVTASLLLFSVLTGLILWWPLGGKWRQAFVIKRKTSSERRLFDIHKTLGFYHALVLMVLLVSGIAMNLPANFNALVEAFSPLNLAEQTYSRPIDGQLPINWGLAAQIADSRYPDGKLAWLIAPKSELGIYQVCKSGVPLMVGIQGYRCVWIDQYNQDILQVIDATTGSIGDILLQWQWPLHSGRALGWLGRILVFMTGLVCPVLYITGVMRWQQKRRAAKLHQTKKTPA
jgi:uncharacterized iron-regulated membrane protein